MNSQTKTHSYKASLAELRTNLGKMMPLETLEVFNKDAEDLAHTHASVLKLHQGDKAPDFTLPNATGNAIGLAELLKKGKVVLSFYRGSWCPYCNLQLGLYQNLWAIWKRLEHNWWPSPHKIPMHL